jgi:predicted phosphoribosyltransferase
MFFRDREDAALQLAAKLKGRPFRDPLVLAVPRGGVVTGAVLARELRAELDVILARKLRAPNYPEFALGAVSETGEVYLNEHLGGVGVLGLEDYLTAERRTQVEEIARGNRQLREIRPPADVMGRSVIVTDDGIATGATLIAALKDVRHRNPHELIVAVPVAAPDSLPTVEAWCDEVVCLHAPAGFRAVGYFFEDFSPVEDDTVRALLRAARPAATSGGVP